MFGCRTGSIMCLVVRKSLVQILMWEVRGQCVFGSSVCITEENNPRCVQNMCLDM